LKFFGSLICLLLLAVPPFTEAQQIAAPYRAPGDLHRATHTVSPAREEAYSKEPYVIEKYTTQFRFESDGSRTRTVFARVRIQSALAAQKFSQLAFNYDSSSGSLQFQLVKVRRPDGTGASISPDSAKDIPTNIARDALAYDSYRQKTISVAALQPGDILEYQTVTRLNPQTDAQFWLRHSFISEAIVLDERLDIDVPKSRHVTFKSPRFPYSSDPASSNGRAIYHWKHANLALPPEDESVKGSPQSAELKPANVNLTTFASWDEIAHWYGQLVRPQGQLPAEVSAEVTALTRDRTDDLEKIRGIYNYVSKNIRYVDLPFSPETQKPHSAAQVFNQQYASAADKQVLLTAMLEAAGISSEPALIPEMGALDSTAPSPAQFNRILTVVTLGDRTIWLDPSTGAAPFEFLPASVRKKTALLISPAGPGKILETPLDPPFPSTQRVEIEGNVSDLGKLTGQIRYELRGDNEYVLRLAFQRTPESQWKELAQTILALDGLHGDILAVKPTDSSSTENPFVLEVEYSQPNFVDWSSPRMMVPIPLLAIGMPDAPKNTSSAIDLGSPLRVMARLKLTFPQNFAARAPAAITVSRDYAAFDSSYAFEGHVLSAQRNLDFKARSVPAGHTDDYLAFSHAVAADQAQPLDIENSAASTPAILLKATSVDLYETAVAALSSGNTRSAIPLFERLVETEPAYPHAWNQLGLAYMRAGQLDLASNAFQKQLEIDPADSQTHNYLGLALEEQHKNADAIAAFRRQIALDPLDKVAHEALGRIYLSEHDYAQSLPEFDKAAVLTPDKPSLQLSLADAYLNLGQNDSALAAFEKAVALSPTPSVWSTIARELADHKIQLDKAQQYAQLAVSSATANLRDVDLAHLPPDQFVQEAKLANTWDTLGWVYFQKNDFDNAQRYIRSAWLLNPRGETAFHLGLVYERRNQKQEAIQTYALALVAPDPDPEAQARLTLLLGGNSDIPELLVRTKAGAPQNPVFRTGNPSKATGVADFLIALSPASAPNSSAHATAARYIAGKEELQPFANHLGPIDFGLVFPARSPQKLVRTGRLECSSPSSECTLTLLPLGTTSSAEAAKSH
jgi:tetratricopeptide (TPR) repeat protein